MYTTKLATAIRNTTIKRDARLSENPLYDINSGSGVRGSKQEYTLGSVFARGNIGILYSVVEDTSKIIKILAGKHRRNSSMLIQFVQEVQLSARLVSPNLPACLDSNSSSNPFALFEKLDGITLAELLVQTPLDLQESLLVFLGLCGGLKPVHKVGYYHGDVGPNNVFLDKQRPRVLDLGIAQKCAYPSVIGGKLYGTFAYSSPEQLTAAGCDGRSDIYSSALLLTRMIFGRLPLGVTQDMSFEEILRLRLNRVPDLPTLPSIPAPIIRLIRACLDKEPKNRPANVDELESEIRSIL
ncbi:serine/threonine protein kinase [Candidatus Micrarchaeota archaeon]|nr:serine/threonine protein kinase [Candidatus Micrarchaeota archaeon]